MLVEEGREKKVEGDGGWLCFNSYVVCLFSLVVIFFIFFFFVYFWMVLCSFIFVLYVEVV